MKIPVLSKIDKFYEQLVQLMSSFAPIKSLGPREKQILVDLLIQNYNLKDLPENSRFILIFSTENRKDMSERLGITLDNLYQHFALLRKKGVLTSDNKIPPFLSRIIPKDEFEFTIIFKLQNGKEQE